MTAIATIYACRRNVGMDDDTARDIYERITGKRSLRAMNRQEQNAVVEEFRALARRNRNAPPRRMLEGKYARKLQALWIAGWNLGLVRNRDDKALLAFVRRQTGIDHTRFLHHADDAAKAIEALKGWLARDGGVDWSAEKWMPDWYREPGARIADAQFRKLTLLCRTPCDCGLRYFAFSVAGKPVERMEGNDWIPVMNRLGAQIRRVG